MCLTIFSTRERCSNRNIIGLKKSIWVHPSKHSSWWRHLEDVFRLCLQTTSSRRLQDVFMTSSRHLQDVLKTSSKRLQHLFKASSRCLQDIFKTSCKDIFKTFSRRTIKFDLLNTSSRSIQHVSLYRGICLGNTISEKFMVSVQNLQERYKILKF